MQFVSFWLLGYAGWVGEALYSLGLQRITVREALRPPLVSILWKQALLNGVIVAAACLAGGLLQKRVPWPSRVELRTGRDVAWTCGIGSILAGMIILLDAFVFQKTRLSFGNLPRLSLGISLIGRLGASAFEEVVFRFGVFSLLLWILGLFWRGRPTFWIGNVFNAVIFSAAHLPITFHLASMNVGVIVRAFCLNGLAGFVFGWVFIRWGLGGAILAHGFCDVFIALLTGG